MSRIVVRLEIDRTHVFQIRPLRFPIDRTFVEFRILARGSIDSKHINDWHLLVQHFWFTLYKFARFPVQASTLQEHSAHVHALWWRIAQLFFVMARDQVLKYHRV